MAAEAKFQLVGMKELAALRWAAEAVSAIPCPAGCLNGSLAEQIAPGEWVEVECEWCAMERCLQAAAGYEAEVRNLIKLPEPCSECGKYSYHTLDCARAKRIDALYCNYIPKSWEPSEELKLKVGQRVVCNGQLNGVADMGDGYWLLQLRVAEGNYDIKGEHPDPLLDDFCVEESEPLEHDETTGTGSDRCEYCRHRWCNHIDHSYEDGGHVGCVLADCDCEESPMIVRPTSTPAPIPQEARPEPPEQDERGQGPQIHELVAADLVHRDSSGAEELMMSSSDCEIDTLEHAYQETLDLALYLRRLIWEWKCVMGSDGSV